MKRLFASGKKIKRLLMERPWKAAANREEAELRPSALWRTRIKQTKQGWTLGTWRLERAELQLISYGANTGRRRLRRPAP